MLICSFEDPGISIWFSYQGECFAECASVTSSTCQGNLPGCICSITGVIWHLRVPLRADTLSFYCSFLLTPECCWCGWSSTSPAVRVWWDPNWWEISQRPTPCHSYPFLPDPLMTWLNRSAPLYLATIKTMSSKKKADSRRILQGITNIWQQRDQQR